MGRTVTSERPKTLLTSGYGNGRRRWNGLYGNRLRQFPHYVA